jgi:ketosteroid isomerase-like protein
MSTPEPFAEAERIRQANQAWVKAERARDLDGIMPHIAEKAVIHPQGAQAIRGREAVREFYQEFLKLPFLDFAATPDEILVAASGDLAMDLGRFHIVFENEGAQVRRQSKYLAVWQKSGGEWKCIALSLSDDAPAQ